MEHRSLWEEEFSGDTLRETNMITRKFATITCNNCGSTMEKTEYVQRYYKGTPDKKSKEYISSRGFRDIDIKATAQHCNECNSIQFGDIRYMDSRQFKFMNEYIKYNKKSYYILKAIPITHIYAILILFMVAVLMIFDRFFGQIFDSNTLRVLYRSFIILYLVCLIIFAKKSTLIRRLESLQNLKNIGKYYQIQYNTKIREDENFNPKVYVNKNFRIVNCTNMDRLNENIINAVVSGNDTWVHVTTEVMSEVVFNRVKYMYLNYVKPEIVISINEVSTNIVHVRGNYDSQKLLSSITINNTVVKELY